MRSLNRSLPSSAPIQTRTAPPEQILQAFKQAALSVTNLYKAAATDQEKARQTGYQDAIEDLLHFLDRENIGLQDGEGWRIREWATAQHSHGGILPQSDEDEETAEQDQEHHRERPLEEKSVEETRSSTLNSVSTASASSTHTPTPVQSISTFQFSASHDSGMQPDDSGSRSHRNVHRSTRHARSSRSVAQSAGSKRKLPFPDLTEIFNVNFDRKDGFDGGANNGGGGGGGGGGSKRTRIS